MFQKLLDVSIILLRDIVSIMIFLCIIVKRLFSKSTGIRILVYHEVGNSQHGNQEDPMKLIVSQKLFFLHMKFLEDNNYQVISFSSFLDMLDSRVDFNPQTIVLSFDDGFKGVYSYAIPILVKYNYPAIFFLTTDFIDKKIESFHFCGCPYTLQPLSWDQVRQMSSNFSFGSHSSSHQRLNNLKDNRKELNRELVGSKKRIEEIIGREVDSFAIPYGVKNSFNEEIVEAIKAAGYKAILLNRYGLNKLSENKFALRRTRIYSNDNLFRFKMKLLGAYDWVDFIRF